MSLVLDASLALAWCFHDEHSPAGLALFGQVVEAGAEAPSHWPLEVANTLLVAQRRKRLDARERDRYLAMLCDLPVTLDGTTAAQAWSASVLLAERHGLTLYDAAYLELALRRDLPLATLDGPLRKAAAGAGVRVLPPA